MQIFATFAKYNYKLFSYCTFDNKINLFRFICYLVLMEVGNLLGEVMGVGSWGMGPLGFSYIVQIQ